MNWRKTTNKIYEDRAELLNIQEKGDKIKFRKILVCPYELKNHLNSIRLKKIYIYIYI
jgi:hypothetical protein